MTDSSRVVDLPDGRRVGVWEYGAPGGFPVLAFHGNPACGVGFAAADGAATRLGLRVLAPDRPGVGASTPSKDWTVRSYAGVVDELVTALAIRRFAVWGYSGGGPYALACGSLLASKVSAVAVTAGMGEVGVSAGPGDFGTADRLITWLSLRSPVAARFVLGAAARGLSALPPAVLLSSVPYRESTEQAEARSVPELASLGKQMFVEAVRLGAGGVAADYAALSGRWDLDLAGIPAPVLIFHGDQDGVVPLSHARDLARRIPAARLTVWSGAGHLAPLIRTDEVLTGLRDASAPTQG